MRIARALAIAAGLSLAALAASSSVRAADEGGVSVDSIKKAGALRVGTWLQYKPEMWKDLQTGEIKGFWVDIWLQEQINNGTYRSLYLKDIGWEPAIKELMLQRGGYPD